MKLSEFNFEFPTELLGIHPLENRDDSRLLVVHRETGKIEHKYFKNITDYFTEDDVIIFNDTKVFPARLMGNKEKTGDDIEVFLLRELNREDFLWDVLVDPARKIRVGNKLYFGEGELVAEVIDNTTSRGRTVKFIFNGSYDDFISRIDSLGETPLPKVLNRPVLGFDKERFQTVYAKELGAVSAPIAGLHFTEQYLKRLEILGVHIAKITLHIGLGTFRNVEVEDLTKHKTDSEYFSIKKSQANIINEGIRKKKKICAIGTTTLKTIESSVSANNLLKEKTGWTDKFIFPPYEFKIGNCMLTNFHLPKSTLYMMTCALAGFDLTQKVYAEAIKKKYRFFTYGDALLII